MRRCAVIGVVAALAGCGVTPLKPVKTPIPVECRVQWPARPAMPTEALAAGVDLDQFSATALAEIGLREEYEGELRAALAICTALLRPS